MPDDKPLDPLHDEELSALYALTRDPAHSPAPSAEAEARILAAAREPAQAAERRGPHYVRWASAAVLILAVGVVWRGVQEGTPAGSSVLHEATAPQRLPAAPPAPAMLEESAAKESTARQRSLMNDAPAALAKPSGAMNVVYGASSEAVESPPPAKADVVESDAVESESTGAGVAGVASEPEAAQKKMAAPYIKEEDPRLAAIRAMHAEGRTEEARTALTALLAEQPDLELDPELRALLP